jgi:geranylgeranyl pyrophosphate synthase
MNNFLTKINTRLAQLLENADFQPRLGEAMRYAALGQGKRLRPQMLLAAFEAAGGVNADAAALDFGCALELIHAYSLVHDDLPAMDDDDLRRGRPTVHIEFDEATAILAGDALLNLVFEIMAHICAETSNLAHCTAMSIIAQAGGAKGMIGGQMDDLQSEGKQIELNALWHLHRRKTAALFSAALQAGAVLGGAPQEFSQEMKRLGELVGILFQMRDDILDITSTTENLGKPTGSDTKNKKVTFVTLQGLDTARETYKALCGEALENLARLPCKTGALHDIIHQIIIREK